MTSDTCMHNTYSNHIVSVNQSLLECIEASARTAQRFNVANIDIVCTHHKQSQAMNIGDSNLEGCKPIGQIRQIN